MANSEMIAFIAKSGVFALLFVMLLVYLLKQNNSRENKYQDTIKSLSDALMQLDEIKVEVREIKRIVKANLAVSPPRFSVKRGGCYEQ